MRLHAPDPVEDALLAIASSLNLLISLDLLIAAGGLSSKELEEERRMSAVKKVRNPCMDGGRGVY